MNAFVFSAGEHDVRHTLAVHRLTDAAPPRRWSVEVNRDTVHAGDLAFLWQTGDDNDLLRPGLLAAGVVYRFDGVLQPHWRDPADETMYVDLELTWVPIIDRAVVRSDKAAGGPMRRSVLASTQQQIRSATLLLNEERDWLLAKVGRNTRPWVMEQRKRALNHST